MAGCLLLEGAFSRSGAAPLEALAAGFRVYRVLLIALDIVSSPSLSVHLCYLFDVVVEFGAGVWRGAFAKR